MQALIAMQAQSISVNYRNSVHTFGTLLRNIPVRTVLISLHTIHPKPFVFTSTNFSCIRYLFQLISHLTLKLTYSWLFTVKSPEHLFLSSVSMNTFTYRQHQNVSRCRGTGMPSVPPSEDKEAVQSYLPCFIPLMRLRQKNPCELLLRPTTSVVIALPARAAAYKWALKTAVPPRAAGWRSVLHLH